MNHPTDHQHFNMEVQLLCALQPRYANDVLMIWPKTSEYVIGGIEIYPQIIFADAGPWHLRFEPGPWNLAPAFRTCHDHSSKTANAESTQLLYSRYCIR